MLRACITCKDQYYGDSWGNNPLGLEFPTIREEIIDGKKVLIGYDLECYYCYYGLEDRKWKPEWV
jgi:hypothetical protein